MRFSTVIAAGLPLAVLGAPATGNTPQKYPSLYSDTHASQCKAIGTVITAIKKLPTPTKFCSSYLHIPTVTSTVTKTSTKVVPVTSNTYTSTTTITRLQTSTDTKFDTVTSFTSTQINTETSTSFTTADTKTISVCNGATVTPNPPAKRAVQCTQPGLKSYAPSKISTGCSCLNIPTPTTTVTRTATVTSTSTNVVGLVSSTTQDVVAGTATTTVTSTTNMVTTTVTTTTDIQTTTPSTTVTACPAPTTCGNQGLGFAVYQNNDGPNPGGNNHYSNFNPQGYKDVNPLCTGTTNTLGGFDYPANDNGLTIYGQCYVDDSDYFALNQRGYIFAQQTGVYTFSASNIDDVVQLWVGNNAYSGWTRDNANLDQAYGQAPRSYSQYLVAGQYYPIRIVFGQAQAAAAFQMTVTAPDGTTFLGPDSGSSPYLVSYSCDGTTAPQFPPFGSES